MQREVVAKASPLALAHQVAEMAPPFVKQGSIWTIPPKEYARVRGNLAKVPPLGLEVQWVIDRLGGMNRG